MTGVRMPSTPISPANSTPSVRPMQAAEQADHQRLDDELHQDVVRPRADRLAQADLAGPLGDAHEHDVHDADAADQERDGGDGRQEGREQRR